MPRKRKIKKVIVLRQNLVIPAGTTLTEGPSEVTYGDQPYETTIGLGPDAVANFVLTEGDAELNPEIFRIEER